MALLRSADAVRRYMAERLAGHGITLQQYNVLRILRGARGQDIATLEVANRMIEKTPGITRLIDRLERRGWVERKRCPEDRRRVYCRITSRGLAFLGKLDPVIDEAERAAMVGLPIERPRAFVKLLDGVRKGVKK